LASLGHLSTKKGLLSSSELLSKDAEKVAEATPWEKLYVDLIDPYHIKNKQVNNQTQDYGV